MKSTLCLVQQAAVKFPNRIAIDSGTSTFTYNELDRVISEAAQQISELGLTKGSVVAFQYPNSWRNIVLIFALFRLRLIASPLNIWLPPHAILAQRKQLGPHRWLEPALLEALVPNHSQLAASYAESSFTSPATLLFTSGSSGQPKAALHSQIQHLFSALGSNENIEISPGDRWLLNLPLYHVGGLAILFRCWITGATVVLPETTSPPSLIDLEKNNITHASFVPTQLFRALNQNNPARPSPSTLKCALIGGAPLTSELRQRAFSLGWPIATSYGLTEMSSQVTTTRPGQNVSHSGSLLNYRNLKIARNGEILVRGPTLFSGYWHAGEVRQELDEEGWFHTGDLGRMTADGGLEVSGRKDHLFISGGENIQPEEIELAITEIDDIEQSIVVPVPHLEFGARPVAFVRTPHFSEGKFPLWQEHLARALPRYKIPMKFLPWPEGPETSGLKPDRRALCALAERSF